VGLTTMALGMACAATVAIAANLGQLGFPKKNEEIAGLPRGRDFYFDE